MDKKGLSLSTPLKMQKKFEINILFGGQAGDGIRQLGTLWAKLLAKRGLYVFLYDDYPSLIRGGHNFSIVRAANYPVETHKDQVDLIVALDLETINRHHHHLSEKGFILSEGKTSQGFSLPWSKTVKEAGVPRIMKNTVALGSLAKFCGISFEELSQVVKKLPQAEKNLEMAQKGYNLIPQTISLPSLPEEKRFLFYGNEAIALGAVAAGLKFYIAYPMTPASSILHYLAARRETFGVNVIHPENEIAAVLAALGSAYTGSPAMVGTSGGGFALMVEALSLSAQAEIPITFVECQRPGPSTGVPTYTMQGDLEFVLHAGHGEFPRVVLAPGDAFQAFYLTALALSLAWRYQIPTFILSDKHLSESLFCQNLPEKIPQISYKKWHKKDEYQRYSFEEDGISPLAFPGDKRAVVKATSYEHDPFGITTEEAEMIARMQAKRLKKENLLLQETEKLLETKGPERVPALVCWGSSKGAVQEVCKALGLRFIQPLVLRPFPKRALEKALAPASKVIVCETNATGQLAKLLKYHDLEVDEVILRYDGRPFTTDSLKKKVEPLI